MPLFLLAAAAAETPLTFRDTLDVQEAKLYQQGSVGYSVELVEIKGEKARFFINGRELTPFMAEGEAYKIADGSTLEPTLIKSVSKTVKFLFFGSGKNPLRLLDSQDYRAKSIDPQYNYTSRPALSNLPASKSGNQSPAPVVSFPQPAKETTPPVRVEEVKPTPEQLAKMQEPAKEKKPKVQEITIEEESEVSSIGWLNRLVKWIKGLFG